MKIAFNALWLILICVSLVASPARAQKLLSEVRGSANFQIAMLSVNNRGCAAGIIVGFDDKNLYIATAYHIVGQTMTGTSPPVTVHFYGLTDARQGAFLANSAPPNAGDLAVVVVLRDATLNKFLDGLNFALLGPNSSLAANAPVTSLGCWGGQRWAVGSDEAVLTSNSGAIQIRSTVNEGQSGGGLFNEAWELVGMPLRASVNQISARPIRQIISQLEAWRVPVALKPRPFKDRVMGAAELVKRDERLNTSQILAAQSDALHESAPTRALLLAVESARQTSPDGFTTAPAREALGRGLVEVTGVGLTGHADIIERSAFSANERLLATASRDGVVRIWSLADPASPKCMKVIKAAETSPDFLAFDQASKRLFTLELSGETRAGELRAWILDTDGLSSPLDESWTSSHHGTTAAAVSPGGDVLAMTQLGGRLVLQSLSGVLPDRILSTPPGLSISQLRFSRDSSILLAGASQARALIWDLSASSLTPTAVIETHHNRLGAVQTGPSELDLLDISDDRRMLLTGSTRWEMESRFADPQVRLWPLQGLAPKGEPFILDQSRSDSSKALAAAFFTEDSRELVAVTLTGRINRWDLAKLSSTTAKPHGNTYTEIELGKFAQSVAHSADRRLMTLTAGESAAIVSVSDISTIKSADITRLTGLDASLETVNMSPTGRFLFASALGAEGRLWDLQHVDPVAPVFSTQATPYLNVEAVRLSDSGKTMAVLRGSSIEVWDIANLAQPTRLFATAFPSNVNSDCPSCQVIVSPDEQWIVIQSAEPSQSRVFELRAGSNPAREFAVPARTWSVTREITFSHDSHWLFVSERNQVETVYDLREPKPRRLVIGEGPAYFDRTFSSDGKWVIYRRFGRQPDDSSPAAVIVPLGALTDPSKRTLVAGFQTGVGTAEFSPDGLWLAIAGQPNYEARKIDDRTVRLLRLDGQRWVQQADMQPIEYAASALRFSPDGRWLFTGSSDIALGDHNVSARLWDLASPLNKSPGRILPDLIWNMKLVAFSPDSQWLVTVSGGEAYGRLWRLKNHQFKMVSQLAGPRPALNNHWSAVFTPDAKGLILSTNDDSTPYYWDLSAYKIPELGVAIHNGDRAIEDTKIVDNGRTLLIVNSGETATGTSGRAGSHLTLVDLKLFPTEDAYGVLPVAEYATVHGYREDLGLFLSMRRTFRATPTTLDSALAHAKVAAGRNLTWDEWVKSPLRGDYRPTFPELPVGADVLKALAQTLSNLLKQGRKADAAQLERNLSQWTGALGEGSVCNDVAWELAKAGYLRDAAKLTDCALSQAPLDPNYRDTHGVILALSGRRVEAIEELQYFVVHAAKIERFAQAIPIRQRWIDRLRAGQDPFKDDPL
jgi:WD40 repeat protein